MLHTTPYSESSVVVKVFTRLLGVRSYIVKGVRGPRGKVKQNLLQPLSCVDMVVYDNPKTDLNYIKELSPRHPSTEGSTHSPSSSAAPLQGELSAVPSPSAAPLQGELSAIPSLPAAPLQGELSAIPSLPAAPLQGELSAVPSPSAAPLQGELSAGLRGAPSPYENALRFFMTEVLYKALREAEPMPALWDYIESVGTQRAVSADKDSSDSGQGTPCPYDHRHLPITFLLTVARHMGIEPLDNYSSRESLFDLQEGRFVATPTETTLSSRLSETLHNYLGFSLPTFHFPLNERTALINALIAYYQLHLSGFHHFYSHEILHTILK